MLGDNDAHATIAVKNLTAARKFYEGTLGLKVVHTEGKEAVSYKSGNSQVLVYHSQYAGTNKATSATWSASSSYCAILLWTSASAPSSRSGAHLVRRSPHNCSASKSVCSID